LPQFFTFADGGQPYGWRGKRTLLENTTQHRALLAGRVVLAEGAMR